MEKLLYYRKELATNQLFIGGAAVPFEMLEGNRGVIALDPAKDNALITGLDAAASKRVGGVIKISAEDYEDLKKNHPFNPSASRLRKDVLQVMPSPHKPKPAVIADSPPTPAAPATPEAPAPAAPTAPAALDPAKPLAQGGKPATRRIGKAVPAAAPAADSEPALVI